MKRNLDKVNYSVPTCNKCGCYIVSLNGVCACCGNDTHFDEYSDMETETTEE